MASSVELDLFTVPEAPMRFDGETYDAAQDESRLAAQHRRVLTLMQDHRWRTLDEIAQVTGDPPTSISARLRDLRKKRFGGRTVDRRRRSRGLFEYRLVGG